MAIAGHKGALHKIPQHRLEERPANRTRRGVETAVLGPIQDWRRLEQGAGRTVKDLSLGPGPCFQNLAPKRGALKAPQGGRIQVIHYLLDTTVVCELRKPKPHGEVLAWLQSLREDRINISAVTMGQLQRGIERTRRRSADKAREIDIWLGQLEASGNLLLMDAACFRESARLISRGSGILLTKMP